MLELYVDMSNVCHTMIDRYELFRSQLDRRFSANSKSFSDSLLYVVEKDFVVAVVVVERDSPIWT